MLVTTTRILLITYMRNPRMLRMRPGFVDPGTIAMIALLAVGAISLATTSGAMEQAVHTDATTSAATEVTAPSPAPLPAEPTVAPTPVPPAPDGTVQPMPADNGAIEPSEPPPEPPPNPQECRDVRRQIRDQFRELNRFEKMLRKLNLAEDLNKLVALRAKLKQFDAGFVRGCTRDGLQEFYDEQVWEDINAFRCKAELPQQFVQIERDFKRLDRQATLKRLQGTGLNPETFKANIEKGKQALAAARAAVAGGSCEDANEAMQAFWEEGMHPGEMMGVSQRLYDLGNQLRRVKDANVREVFQEVLQPVIDAANEGDFREANQALNDVFNELQQILNKVINSRRYRGYEPRLQKLEEMLRGKLESNEPSGAEGGAPAPAMPAPAQ